MGKYYGESHECVALVKYWCNAPETAKWGRGELVKGSDILKGTAIATFNSSGKYANIVGQSHAAIYLSQDSSGIQVIDQWDGQVAHNRTIRFDNSATPVNNGNKFYVID